MSTLLTLEQRTEEAARRGTKAGEARASWVFDGNTDTETYRKVLEGIEDGDPAILDSLDWSPLSGEWAGESVVELLGDLVNDGGEEELSEEEEAAAMNGRMWELEDICEAYEEAARIAYWDAIAAAARKHLED